MGEGVPLGDGSALGLVDLVDVIASDLLAAFVLELLGEVGPVKNASVEFEEGGEVIRYETHLNSSLYIIIASPSTPIHTYHIPDHPIPSLGDLHMFTVAISSCGSGTLHSWSDT